jgi:hypothetical protein
MVVGANAPLGMDFMHEKYILRMLSTSEAGIETDAVARMESHNCRPKDDKY